MSTSNLAKILPKPSLDDASVISVGSTSGVFVRNRDVNKEKRNERKRNQGKLGRLSTPSLNSGARKSGIFNKDDGLFSSEYQPVLKRKSRAKKTPSITTNSSQEDVNHTQQVAVQNPASSIITTVPSIHSIDSSIQDFEILPDCDNNCEMTQKIDELIKQAIAQAEADSIEEPPESSETRKSSKATWEGRIQSLEASWEKMRPQITEDMIAFEAPSLHWCIKCSEVISSSYVKCSDCGFYYCAGCDYEFHAHFAPLHKRAWIHNVSSHSLLPTEFISDSRLITRYVAVPVFPPAKCTLCNAFCRQIREPSPRNCILITQFGMNGRFDLNLTMIKCLSCNKTREVTISEYIVSGYFPGSVNETGSSYLFDVSLLWFWYYTKHCTPGTSLEKFVEILCWLSKDQNRDPAINNTLFQQASRQFEFIEHTLDVGIRRKLKCQCSSCSPKMVSLHTDGNMKLYQFDHERSTSTSKSLFTGPDSILASDEEVSAHCRLINSHLPPSTRIKDTCGDSNYKAGRNDSSKFKGLKATGLMMSSCRHGVVQRAANLYAGENYRIVHFMHYNAYLANCRFLCYDVICNYWPFAITVANKLPQFNDMVTKMEKFQSSFHGFTHTRGCQIQNNGRWKKGAGATTGEEQEQTNATMSRYGNSIKHMTSAAKDEHVSQALYFWNRKKEEKMAKSLHRSLAFAKHYAIEYKSELYRLLKATNQTEESVDEMIDNMLKETANHRQMRRKKIMNVTELENQLEDAHIRMRHYKFQIKSVSDSCKLRTVLRRQESALGIKVDALIASLNGKQSEYQLSIEEFTEGDFPWKPQGTKPFKDQYELADVLMMSRRYQEEIGIIHLEMFQHLNFLINLRRQLSEDVKNYSNALERVEPMSETSLDSRVDLGRAVIAMKELDKVKKKIANAIYYCNTKLSTDLEDALEDDDETEFEKIWEEIVENFENGSFVVEDEID